MEVGFQLFQGFNGLDTLGISQTQEVLDLADDDGHGDTGGEADGDGVGDELDQTAQFAYAHQDQHNAGQQSSQDQTGHTLRGDDACDDGGKGRGGACDLDTAAAEEGDDETGCDGGVDAAGRFYAGGQSQCNGQGQGYDSDNDTGDDILDQLLLVITIHNIEQHGCQIIEFHFLYLLANFSVLFRFFTGFLTMENYSTGC